MPRPYRVTYSGAKYHITSRGNGRQMIFLEPSDYERFLKQLKAALDKDEVILYAYALMPNHYHLMVETPLGNIKRFMQRLNTAYGMYYRYKHSKPGHCFQGRYGAKLVNGSDYIIRLTRYIHLNPIKTKAMSGKSSSERVQYLRAFRWSSLPGYLNKKDEAETIDYRWLSLMGCKTPNSNRIAYQRYLKKMITEDDCEFRKVLGLSRYAIGNSEFIEETENNVKAMSLGKVCVNEDMYGVRQRIVEVQNIEDEVAGEFHIKHEVLHEHGHKSTLAKKVAVYLSCQLSSKSQRFIGQYYGYTSDSSVTKLMSKFKIEMDEDKELTEYVDKLRIRILDLYSIIKV